MDIEKLYKELSDGNTDNLILLNIEDFYTSMLEFDPVTNESLYTNYDELLRNAFIYSCKNSNWFNDRFQNIVNFCESSIYQIMDLLHEKSFREHRISNPNKVRDVDTTCMMWLSKKPGFNIRQKIASEQKMMGVFHETSIDTSENRLFKAFLIKLDNIFAEKEKLMKTLTFNLSKEKLDNIERLISCIHRWKYSEEAKLISVWNNVPPNNTLLNDKNYRKIWKAWNFLQYLDSDIASDKENLDNLIAEITYIYIISCLRFDNRFQVKQDLVLPNYQPSSEKRMTLFSNGIPSVPAFFIEKGKMKNVSVILDKQNIQIRSENSLHSLDLSSKQINEFSLIKSIAESFLKSCFGELHNEFISGNSEEGEKNEIVAIDINKIYPEYVYKNSNKIISSKNKLLCQTVSKNEDFYALPCSTSEYISTQNDDYKVYSIHHFFNPTLQAKVIDDEVSSDINYASSYFAKILSKEVNANDCVYLVPDNLDDFSPITNSLKRALSSQFSKALLLPRSVAAIFSNYKTLVSKVHEQEEFRIEDLYDSFKICVDYKVLYNSILEKICPESKGYVFQRKNVTKVDYKHEITYVPDSLKNIFTNSDVAKLDKTFSIDNYHFDTTENKNAVTTNGLFLNNNRINDYLSGVLFLFDLQKQVDENNNTNEDISLWKDYLPPLYFVQEDKSTFTLVGDDVSINPFSKKEEIIPISTNFELPKNKQFYEFPLIQGEGKEKTRYFAYIKDTALPLDKEIICRLKLTYTYGAPLPYNLEFIPKEVAPFNTLSVRWENKSHRDLLHLPSPTYSEKQTWEEMKHFEGKNGNINFIDDCFIEEVNKIYNKGRIYIVDRIKSNSSGIKDRVFLRNQHFVEKLACNILKELNVVKGQKIWCYVNPSKNHPGKYEGLYPFVVDSQSKQTYRLAKLRMATKTLWNDSRSISDENCPDYFKMVCKRFIDYLVSEIVKDIPQRIKNEYWILLACMAKDVPNEVCQIYTKAALASNEAISVSFRNLGYMLDDLSKDWQQKTLNNILLWLDDEKKYRKAIVTLSRAAWRNENFIYQLPRSAIFSLLNGIMTIIGNFIERPSKFTEEISASLELFLAILRLRNTLDDDLCKLLSPYYNNDIKWLQKSLKQLERRFESDKYPLISFLKFDITESNKGNIPDLIYVVEAYIDGKVDSNSIKILNNSYDEGE